MGRIINEEKSTLSRCVELLSNLGWEVEQEKPLTNNNHINSHDITLSYEGTEYGYVEVISEFDDIETLKRKRERIRYYIDLLKPLMFIITNGELFEIYYYGKYAYSQTIPPTPEGIGTVRRLAAYYEKLSDMIKEKRND